MASTTPAPARPESPPNPAPRPAPGPGTRPAVRPVVLLILDGFGCRPDAPDNAIGAATHAALEGAAGRASAHDDRRLGTPRRPARGPDGQFGSRPPQHRRRPRRLPGLHPDRQGDRRRRVRAQPGARRRGAHGRRPPVARSTCWACCRPAACTATSGRSPRWSTSPRARAPAVRVHAFLDGRDTPAEERRRVAGIASKRCCAQAPRRAHRVDHRPLLRDGPRPALGPGAARPGTRSSTRARRTRAPTAAAALEAAYARGETDEFVAATVIGDARGERPRSPTATSSCS